MQISHNLTRMGNFDRGIFRDPYMDNYYYQYLPCKDTTYVVLEDGPEFLIQVTFSNGEEAELPPVKSLKEAETAIEAHARRNILDLERARSEERKQNKRFLDSFSSERLPRKEEPCE